MTTPGKPMRVKKPFQRGKFSSTTPRPCAICYRPLLAHEVDVCERHGGRYAAKVAQ